MYDTLNGGAMGRRLAKPKPSATSTGNYGGGSSAAVSGGGAPRAVPTTSGQITSVGSRPTVPTDGGNVGTPPPNTTPGGPIGHHPPVHHTNVGSTNPDLMQDAYDQKKHDYLASQPKPPPKPGSIGAYLNTDEQYQQDRADLLKNFRNLRLTNKENRGNLKLDRDTTLERMTTSQDDALEAMKADFASRGLFGGAEYQKKLGDFNEDYNDQRFDTNQSFGRNVQQLLRDLANANTLKQSNLQQARLEAIRRRAAEMGVTG